MEFSATIIDVHPKKKDPEDCAQIELKVTALYNSELMVDLASQLGETVGIKIEPVIRVTPEKDPTQMEIPIETGVADACGSKQSLPNCEYVGDGGRCVEGHPCPLKEHLEIFQDDSLSMEGLIERARNQCDGYTPAVRPETSEQEGAVTR
jgi:hypothetical protein